ncbi:MAG TPA: AzlD domain-containing protein [Phototrophicaceae bacterium]|nr:AzlD domain-containing protein [Phototrophicaceae bacterium]
MNEFVLVLGMGLVTFLIRYPTLVLIGRIPLPDRVFRALRYVPPAVLAAIIVPSVLIPDGTHIDVSISNSYLIAGIVAALISWRTKNLLATIVLGMVVFLIWRLIVGV